MGDLLYIETISDENFNFATKSITSSFIWQHSLYVYMGFKINHRVLAETQKCSQSSVDVRKSDATTKSPYRIISRGHFSNTDQIGKCRYSNQLVAKSLVVLAPTDRLSSLLCQKGTTLMSTAKAAQCPLKRHPHTW